MSQNIYQAPEANLQLDSLPRDKVEFLVSVAKRQKHLLYVFLVYIVYSFNLGKVDDEMRHVMQLLALPMLLAVIIFNIRLSWVLYGTLGRVIMIILGAIPIINFLVILMANSRANRMLSKNGIKVGFMGAKIADIQAKATTT